MRRAILTILVAGLGLATSASAAGFDMKLGEHLTFWCNYWAVLYVESQEPGTWIFHGHIAINTTGEYDPIWMEQYADNSLRIIRYLQGANLGLTQTVQTNPPYERFNGPNLITYYDSQQGYGLGCDGTRTSVEVR